MAQPTFQVHRICGPNGKKFASAGWGSIYAEEGYWTNEGAFFRRMETIRKHLATLERGGKWDMETLYVETFSVQANTRQEASALQVMGRVSGK